jgi:hypothetical protein
LFPWLQEVELHASRDDVPLSSNGKVVLGRINDCRQWNRWDLDLRNRTEIKHERITLLDTAPLTRLHRLLRHNPKASLQLAPVLSSPQLPTAL